MRALVFDKSLIYQPDHAEPSPAKDECVVCVALAGICATDIEITRGYMGFRGVLGHEMVGTVEHGPPELRGRRVACEINCVCGDCDMCSSGLSTHCRRRTVIGIAGRDGCFADHIAVPARNLHPLPDSIANNEAVFIEPLAAAYQVIRRCKIEKRMKVSVVGSGRLGLLVAQLLAVSECRPTVIGRNPRTLGFCEKRGIMVRHVTEAGARMDQDVVVECTGDPQGLAVALQLVRPRGTIVLKSTYAGDSAIDLAPAVINEVRIEGSRCGPFPDAIRALERKAIDVRGMISATYALKDGLAAMQAAADPQNIKILLRIDESGNGH